MLVQKIEAFRYYSDLAGFDLVFVVEGKAPENMVQLMDNLIEKWFDAEGELFYTPLAEYLQHQLKEMDLEVSVYYGGNEDE